jgi:hypothetical protein
MTQPVAAQAEPRPHGGVLGCALGRGCGSGAEDQLTLLGKLAQVARAS